MSERTKLQLDELSNLVLQLQLATHKTADKTDPAYKAIKLLANSLVEVTRSVKLEANS